MTERMEGRRSKKEKQKKPKVKEEVPENSTVEKLKPEPKLKRQGAIVPNEETTKKLKIDYSVAKDPKVSDVYKSLFTTHKSEQEQNRAHWVTYNPFYN